MIKIEDLTIAFNDQTILDCVNMSINQGEKACITGASGTGKTTILLSLMGIHFPKQGKIIFNSTVLNKDSILSIRKQIAWLPQNYHLSIENANELLNNLDIEPTNNILQNSLDTLKLTTSALGKSYQQLSGGEKQRILLSICLAQNRPVLLIDEPTSALDTKTIDDIIKLIFTKSELTVISTSHNLQWLNQCNRTFDINRF